MKVQIVNQKSAFTRWRIEFQEKLYFATTYPNSTLLYLEYASTRKKCKNAKVKAAVSKQLFGEKP